MTKQRLFLTKIEQGTFVIEHIGEGNVDPMTGRPTAIGPAGRGFTAEVAWAQARVQPLPVEVCYLDGECKLLLGTVFDPARYEEAAYQGYVSAGFAMTDGHYSPIQRETWIREFRRNPVEGHLREPEQAHLVAGLELYKFHLARVAS